MVNGELFSGETLPAILTGKIVVMTNIAAVKLHIVFGNLTVALQHNHFRHHQLKVRRMNHIMFGKLRQVSLRFKVVHPIFFCHDARHILIQEAEGAPHSANVNGEPVLI